jgi:hypothetical protein
MQLPALFRSILEIGLGLIFLAGALFAALYTYRHGDVFFGSFAAGAWLLPVRSVIRDVVIPNSRLFTLLLVLFQSAVALSLLTRWVLVRPALLAGALFSLAAVFVSNPAGAVANAVLAVLQAYLALT